jgi:hypothetical protein
MKHAGSRILMVALSAGWLWGGGAWAKSPEQQEREASRDSCVGACREDLQTCSSVCKKHAAAGLNMCLNACKESQKECEQECKSPGRKE